MKWIKNIEDFTEYIFSNNERAAKRHLSKTEAEKPREVFDRVCQIIADELTTTGFQYFHSQHKLRLESIDKKYTLTISFSSNRKNVAGQFVELSSIYYIDSKDLKKFSKKNPLLNYWSETIIGRDIGTLVEGGKGNLVWSLADNKEFENAVSTITKTIKGKLINVFKDLQNTELIVSEIEKNNFELNNPMTTEPDKILNDYKKAIVKFEEDGIPKEFVHGMGYGHEIALLEKAYKLIITVPNSGFA
jgi:hypothetical protein